MAKPLSDEEREKKMAERLWLEYFNNYLFQEGTISQSEYEQMTDKIATYTDRKKNHRQEL